VGKPKFGKGIRRHIGVLVLPNVNRLPSELAQEFVVAAISRNVGIEFRHPPVVVRPRRCSVNWAPVPEASVDEDGRVRPDKHEVRSTRKIAPMESEAHASPMQRSPESEFWLRVSRPLSRHERTYLRRGWNRTHLLGSRHGGS